MPRLEPSQFFGWLAVWPVWRHPNKPRRIHASVAGLMLACGVAGQSPAYPFELAADPSPAPQSRLLYAQDFGDPVVIRPPDACWATGCWQDIVSPGNSSPPSPSRGASANPLESLSPVFMLIGDPVRIDPGSAGRYFDTRIESTAAADGGEASVLFQAIRENANGTRPMGPAATQSELLFVPQDGARELYVRFRIRFQADMVEQMTGLQDGPGIHRGGTWRAFFALKTGSLTDRGKVVDDGDYRVEAYVMTYGSPQPFWVLMADNNAGGNARLVNDWTVENRRTPVPVGEWFLVELYWRRSAGNDGLVWMAVNCRTVAERSGPNLGEHGMPVNRIMAPLLYSGSRMPIYQWVDDLEIWSGLPSRRCDSAG